MQSSVGRWLLGQAGGVPSAPSLQLLPLIPQLRSAGIGCFETVLKAFFLPSLATVFSSISRCLSVLID